MSIVPLHPETTADPRLLRWVTGTVRPLPQLTALVDEGVLDRVEVGPGEVRTWLANNRSWAVAGPRVRSALLEALSLPESPVGLSDDDLLHGIEEILEREVAPIAGSHGGAVHVTSVHDGILTVELAGACRGCSLRGRTIVQLVTRAVQTRYPQIREVRAVKPRCGWRTRSQRRERKQG